MCELNSPIPVHFSSLIPKMLMFTLTISCLTTSNLPWFMDLTFQVPMQYCSLQHQTVLYFFLQTLLSSPVTSTTVYCFSFGSISSFFLELYLHWFPVAYWAPTNLESSSFSVLSVCTFRLFMRFTRQEHWSGLPFPKKDNAKEGSNYCTTAFISHFRKVMLKIIKARLQQHVNHEISDVQASFRKGRGTRDQIANICWIIEKAREFQKNVYSHLITMPKPLTVWITTNCGQFWKRWEYQTTWPASLEIVCRSTSNS